MRILHTADWQLGLRLRFVPGEAGARARAQRFDTVRRLADLARNRGVDAVLVAGDVFDDNGVGNDTLQQARDALAAFAPVPVLLLPGNHDAATPDSALARLAPAAHVRLLLDEEPVAVGGGWVFPCPLRRRHEAGDPARNLPAREAGDDAVRVALAHGGVIEFSQATESPNRIDPEAVLAKGFDYLALGDWHSTLGLGPRVWYPGTPEPTRFQERDAGNALVVELPAAGAVPRVEPVAVGRSRWVSREVTFDDDAGVERLAEWFEVLPERSWTLVSLALSGHLSLEARARLEALLEAEASKLLLLDVGRDEVVEAATDEDLARLAPEGFVGAAVERLRSEDSAEAREALRLLHRLQGGGGA